MDNSKIGVITTSTHIKIINTNNNMRAVLELIDNFTSIGFDGSKVPLGYIYDTFSHVLRIPSGFGVDKVKEAFAASPMEIINIGSMPINDKDISNFICYAKPFPYQEVINKEAMKVFETKSQFIIDLKTGKGKSLTARSINNQDNSILVSEWKKERNEDCYKIHFQLDLSNIILSRNEILNRKNYSLSNNRYIIENIKPIDNKYEFTIQTGKPSPGIVELSYKKNLPDWIENSNYGGPGIPPTDQTLGIKYLINGVFDAYVGGEIFRTKITLK